MKKSGENKAGKPSWLTATPLLDLAEPQLRNFGHALVQGCRGDRECAVAVYRYVRNVTLVASRSWRARKASAVWRREEGNAFDKTTLMVALLRIAGIPARVVFFAPLPEAVSGLPIDICWGPRPIVEARIAGRWVRTDNYLFDDAYLMAARARLQKKREEYGYGLAVAGLTDWDATRNAYVLGADHGDEVEHAPLRPYDDVDAFRRASSGVRRLQAFLKMLAWNTKAAELDRVLMALRAREPRAEAGARAPRRSGAANTGPSSVPQP